MSKQIDLNWSDFKDIVTSKNLVVQYQDLGDQGYDVFVVENEIIWLTTLEKLSLDAIDFETIYLPTINALSKQTVIIQDGGNSITVDGTVELGATTLAALEDINVTVSSISGEVEIKNDSGNPIPVSDNGGSLTVDATDLDIRNLTQSQDSIKIGDGTDFLAINTDGSLNVSVMGGTGGVQYDEDTTHLSGDKLTLAGVIQQSADSALSEDGDRSLLQVDGSGFLKANIKSSVLPTGAATSANQTTEISSLSSIDSKLTGTNSSLSSIDAGIPTGLGQTTMSASMPVTIASDQPSLSVIVSGTPTVILDSSSLTALENITVQNGSGGSAVNIQDGGNSITVDGVVGIRGGTDNTSIGNVGDRLKVDAAISVAVVSPGFPQSVDIDKLLPIGFGESITSPAWPTKKPVGFYVVPTGKKFRLIGVMFKSSAAANYLHVYTRTELWKFGAAASVLVNPVTGPTLTAKTYTGSGLSTLSTYKYKIVATNIMGTTLPGPETSITLTGASNAVSLSWPVTTGALSYEIFRTAANGAANSEYLLQSTELTTFTDVTPDSELDMLTTPPVSNITSGNIDVSAYTTDYAASEVVIDTLYPITTVTPLDIVYKNIYGETNYLTATPGAVAGTQVVLKVKGLNNPLDNKRIKSGVHLKKKKTVEIGVNDIVGVGNLPATGSFVIYGHNHLFHIASQQPNKWDTQFFEDTFVFNSGAEIIFGVSSNSGSTTASRNDVLLLGVLE